MAEDETEKNYQPKESAENSDSISPDDARSKFSEEADALFREQASSSQERSKLVADELNKLAMPANNDQGRRGSIEWNQQDQQLKDSFNRMNGKLTDTQIQDILGGKNGNAGTDLSKDGFGRAIDNKGKVLDDGNSRDALDRRDEFGRSVDKNGKLIDEGIKDGADNDDKRAPSKPSGKDDFNSRMDQLLNDMMKIGESLLPTLELYDEKLRKATTY